MANTAKKKTTKSTVAKKATVKTTAKKTTAKKTAAKPAAKKAPAKKTAVKTAAKKAAPAKKAAAKKAAPKAAAKVSAKPVAKKAPMKKAALGTPVKAAPAKKTAVKTVSESKSAMGRGLGALLSSDGIPENKRDSVVELKINDISPAKFEAGTQNFNAIPTLVPAIEFASTAEADPAILEFVYSKLTDNERITLYGTERQNKVPLFSFAVKGAHHEDLALIMDKMGIALRSGQMCAEPLMDRLGVTGLLRASFAPYNTMQEAEYFIKCLDRAIDMLV